MLADGIGFAAALRSLGQIIGVFEKLQSLQDKNEARHILKSLTKIYFSPEGILETLENIANGQQIDQESYNKIISSFKQANWMVVEANTKLSYDQINSLKITSKEKGTLNRIAQLKTLVRSNIQDTLSLAVNNGNGIDKKSASKLVKEINNLNRKIDEIETLLKKLI